MKNWLPLNLWQCTVHVFGIAPSVDAVPHAAILPVAYPRVAVCDIRSCDILILTTADILSRDDVRIGFGFLQWVAPLELLPFLALMSQSSLESFLE